LERSNGVYLLGDAAGRKLTRDGITRLIRRAVKDAGLPRRCVAHGLRKAILRRLAERGGTSQAIAASPKSSAIPKWPNRPGSIGKPWQSSDKNKKTTRIANLKPFFH